MFVRTSKGCHEASTGASGEALPQWRAFFMSSMLSILDVSRVSLTLWVFQWNMCLVEQRQRRKYSKGQMCPCGNNLRRPGQKNCQDCHAAYMRTWRKTHPLNLEQRKKDNCRSYAHAYLRRGKLQRMPCVQCGDIKSQMHHPDYNKPLLVVWMCRPCHLKLHKDMLQ